MTNTIDSGFDIAAPRPEALIQSLRAFGYDLSTAIADIVDNSISASAKNIAIDFFWNGEDSYISIQDDGCGMSEEELINAMRPGSRSPLEERSPKDLGRFGLGLKTASFSQCKKLTVASKTNDGNFAVRCWDLDYVTEHGEWRLLRSASTTMQHLIDKAPDTPSGTIVLLENLDRLTKDTKVDSRHDHDKFLEDAEKVKNHLAMVFHRYLERINGPKFTVNSRPVKPWDPFLTSEPATQNLTEEAHHILGGKLVVKPYVLPHVSKISQEVHSRAAGPKGWNAQQGFYVYRNSRLLVAGEWLGLGFQKEEHYKLARILLDIPNSMDEHWEIDVKKSRAYPPVALRRELKRLAEVTRQRAADVYRHRGKIIARQHAGKFSYTWDRKITHGKISYKINREHPFIKSLLDRQDVSKEVSNLLKLIEETVPVPTIMVDNAESPGKQAQPFEQAAEGEVKRLATDIYRILLIERTESEAIEAIQTMEPFNQYTDDLVPYLKGLERSAV
ncbi:ATP-binding protein [Candidatus Saccharibacteria bacterium]|nr:ATP-binding protein [Candidatus Saccharibacteria bacterium]